MARASLIALLALLTLLVGSPAAPGDGPSGGVTIVARDLPVGGRRLPAASSAPIRFDLAGLHWLGRGTVSFRTRSLSGRWSTWQTADDDSGPAGGPGWRLGSPVWTGPSDRLEYRLRGRITALRGYYLWVPVQHRALRTLAAAGSPPIVSRSAWGGDELPRRNQPRYAPAVRLVIVHHTATPNGYTPDQAAAIVRGIDVYDVKANGWDDMGYNFLVDRYGRIYEGRYGGITRNVVGAHALGFNRGSVGVAMIGDFMRARPTAAAIRSLERLIAWRLDLAHVDPVSKLTYVSGGSERYRAGTKVVLRAVSGHRDTGSTACPGNAFYPLLGQVAAAAERIGLPKLYAPVVRGTLGGSVVFSARLSAPLPWTITVTGPSGSIAARGAGVGTTVDWTWDSSRAAPSRYTWAIAAGANVLPAGGTIAGSQPPPVGQLIQNLTVSPSVLSPNGDGYADQATVSYALAARSAVTATVVDGAGTAAATLFTAQEQSARVVSFTWSPGELPDGRYALVVTARADAGPSGTASVPVTIDRVLSSVAAAPTPVGAGGTLTASFALAGDAEVTVSVLAPDGSIVTTLFAGGLGAGTYSYTWTAMLADGTSPPPGHYQLLVSAVDMLGTITQAAAFDISPAPP